jgi:hypothetical protein
MQAVKIVSLVKATKRIPDYLANTYPYSSLALWTYYNRAHHDPEGESCPVCMFFDGQTFTGSQLRTVFPDHYFVGDDIYPNVHKTLWGKDDTCSCLLIREPDVSASLNLSMYSGVGGDWRDKINKKE